MEEKNLYYKGSKKFKIGNPNLTTYMCKGQRGRGKTTFWVQDAGYRSLINQLDYGGVNPNKFTFLRRTEEQLLAVCQKGIFTGVFSVPEYREKFRGFVHEKIWNKNIILSNDNGDEIPVGYIEDLNNVKGKAVEDTDVLIFDEFVEPQRSKYKGGYGGIKEPELLARLDETYFRRRNNWFILLGNFDSPSDPYCEYFGVPYGVNSYSDRKRGLFYEVDYSVDTEEEKRNTSTGRRWADTDYYNYSNGRYALGSLNEELILSKPNHAIHEVNFISCGVNLTAWIDPNTGIYYFHDNYKIDNTKPIYSVMSSDMKVNTYFVGYNSQVIRMFRMLYGCGKVRFNNQKTASLFSTMIKLID